MLEQQLWMKYPLEMELEWKQARDEGKDVEGYLDECKKIAELAKTQDCQTQAAMMREVLLNAPVKAGYPFIEPSTLEEIKASRPAKHHQLENNLTQDVLYDRIKGAWIGRISGCLLGKPVECMMSEDINNILKGTNNYPLTRYMTVNEFSEDLVKRYASDKCWADTIGGIAPIDDDTNYTVFTLKLMETYGLDFRPNDVLEAWLSWMPMFATCTAERIAYRNAAMGMYAPQTAHYNNPYREWIGAQIRGDFFGYINPGDCEKAAEMAWRDASISHVKNGIYGEMFVAAMIAAASVSDDMVTVVESGLQQIPLHSRLRADIDKVLNWYAEGKTVDEAIALIHEVYDEHDWHWWCHTNSNAMIVVMALLYGEKDFAKSICYAVQAAFDTDCNGATVGSIIGIMVGAQQIPSYWYECYNQKLSTSISGYNEVTVDYLTEKTVEMIKAK